MPASLTFQALSERRRFYASASCLLAVYLAAACAVAATLDGESSAAGATLAKVDRVLQWTVDPSGSLVVDWLNAGVFALGLPALLTALTVSAVWGFTRAGHDRDQLGLLLSYPIPRGRIFGKIAFLMAGVAAGFCAFSAGVLLLVSGILRIPLSVGNVAGIFGGLWLLCLLYGFIAFLAGNLTRKPWLSIAIVVSVFLIDVLIYLLPGFTSILPIFRWASPFSPYLDGNPLLNGFELSKWLILAGWVGAAGLAAWLQFERTDLG